MTSLYLPIDEITGQEGINYNLAADFLELSALFSSESTAATAAVVNEASIGASEDYSNLTDEFVGRADLPSEEEIHCGVVERVCDRKRVLNRSYPFTLDANGDWITYHPSATTSDELLGPTAYTMSLLLSNLRGVSPILDDSNIHPNENEQRDLRRFFQYFATAALAAEINGHAWSFGFPRPDGSGFMTKLREIWNVLGDGLVQRQIGAPPQPKDDGIDVFAARLPADGLPGFPLVAAQVATGKDFRDKSAKGRIGRFKERWFGSQPATHFIVYMVVPFVMEPDQFKDDVRTLGNVLHRLRLPKRVGQAVGNVSMDDDAITFEGYEYLTDALRWIHEYRRRAIGGGGDTERRS